MLGIFWLGLVFAAGGIRVLRHEHEPEVPVCDWRFPATLFKPVLSRASAEPHLSQGLGRHCPMGSGYSGWSERVCRTLTYMPEAEAASPCESHLPKPLCFLQTWLLPGQAGLSLPPMIEILLLSGGGLPRVPRVLPCPSQELTKPWPRDTCSPHSCHPGHLRAQGGGAESGLGDVGAGSQVELVKCWSLGASSVRRGLWAGDRAWVRAEAGMPLYPRRVGDLASAPPQASPVNGRPSLGPGSCFLARFLCLEVYRLRCISPNSLALCFVLFFFL